MALVSAKVIPALQADGYEVIAVQYGLDSFDEDLATVKRTLIVSAAGPPGRSIIEEPPSRARDR